MAAKPSKRFLNEVAADSVVLIKAEDAAKAAGFSASGSEFNVPEVGFNLSGSAAEQNAVQGAEKSSLLEKNSEKNAEKPTEKPVEKNVEKPAEILLPKNEAAKTTQTAEVCLEYAELLIGRANQVEALSAKRFPAFRLARVPLLGRASFWVHIPPQASKALAEKKTAELAEMKIRDYFIVEDGSADNFAVSLGVFVRRESAEKMLLEMKEKGVRSAIISEKNDRPALVKLQLRGGKTEAQALQNALKEAIPNAKLQNCSVS